MRTLKTLLLIFTILGIMSCAQDINDDNVANDAKLVAEYPNDVVHEWNEVFLQIERYAAGYRPGPAPRAVVPRGLEAVDLQIQAADFHLKGKAYSSVRKAFAAAKAKAKKDDLIFVGGSIFIVAEVLSCLASQMGKHTKQSRLCAL